MPRLSVPLTPEQHRAIKVKAAETGLPQAEIARRFLLAWVAGEAALENSAIELWRRWFEWRDSDPWFDDNMGGGTFCIFCGENKPNHKQDCVYLAAKDLLEGLK